MTGRCRIVEDSWLGRQMERPVFKVVVEHPAGVSEVAGHVQSHAGAFYFATVDCRQVDIVQALLSNGFVVVDTNVTFVAERAALLDLRSADVVIQRADRAMGEAAVDIASRAFRFSRFHLDPRVSAETANRIKREWVASYARGDRGAELQVALLGGKTAGFNAILDVTSSRGTDRVIDLLAVAPEDQGRGVGAALVSHFLYENISRYERLLVGTQVANVPSMRLYEQAGFRIAETRYVLHLHSPEREQ